MMRANRSNVHVLRIPLPFRLREVNLYLLKDHAGYTLIDTGPNTSLAVAALERELADLGVSWERIHTILITHYHSDHCGLAAEVRRRSGLGASSDLFRPSGKDHRSGRVLPSRRDASGTGRRPGQVGPPAHGPHPALHS